MGIEIIIAAIVALLAGLGGGWFVGKGNTQKKLDALNTESDNMLLEDFHARCTIQK